MAERGQHRFDGNGKVVQFHPGVTYETFIVGLAPELGQDSLSFAPRNGWLTSAAGEAANGQEYLLVLDEINRADLAQVLGEAIHLFEPGETKRSVQLPFPREDGEEKLALPPNLFVVGTMNTADRSIAILDLAIRRRFAFVDVWPDLSVVEEQGLPLATEAFGRLQDVFVEHAPADALSLLPGHAYFLADSEHELLARLRFELVPLLEEYILEGRLGACENELRAYLDWIDGVIS